MAEIQVLRYEGPPTDVWATVWSGEGMKGERNRNQPDENSVWLGICLQVRQGWPQEGPMSTFWTPEQVPRLLDPSPELQMITRQIFPLECPAGPQIQQGWLVYGSDMVHFLGSGAILCTLDHESKDGEPGDPGAERCGSWTSTPKRQ